MRVLQLNNMGIQWGFEHSAANQFQALLAARPGLDFRILRDEKFTSIDDVRVVTPPKFVRSLPWALRSLFRLGQALRIIACEKIDFVHGVHLWPHGILGWIAARSLRRKCGVTIVGGSAEIYRLGPWMRRLAVFCMRHCDVVIVTGGRTREHFIERGVDPDRIVVIQNVTDMDRYSPDPGVKKVYDVVSTNRLYAVKNLGVLLRAVAKAREKRPGLRVAMGGTGDEMENLKSLAGELGLGETVEFLGWMDDVAATLRTGRVYMLTSRAEGFPISVLEAMACGLPCIVSNVGDMPDVARHGWNALVIEDCDDVDAFAGALLSLLEDPALYRRLSENAVKVRETHSFTEASKRWSEVLARLESGMPGRS